MTKIRVMSVLVFVLLIVSGCATMPTGPSVMVLPGEGKTFEQFQADDSICRQWASQQIGGSAQETANQNVVQGAAVGTLLGAAAGAAIGSASGHAGQGAAIGAGTGLLAGTAVGASSGQASGWDAQRRYDIAYQQCMYSKGNQISGRARHSRSNRQYLPPPPPPGADTVPPDYYPQDYPPR